MLFYHTRLQALLEQIPVLVAEDELDRLEQVATEFRQILKMVHQHNSDLKKSTQFFYERVEEIEAGLFQAKYGHDQKQRDSAFKKAKDYLRSGVTALAKIVAETEDSGESIY